MEGNKLHLLKYLHTYLKYLYLTWVGFFFFNNFILLLQYISEPNTVEPITFYSTKLHCICLYLYLSDSFGYYLLFR